MSTTSPSSSASTSNHPLVNEETPFFTHPLQDHTNNSIIFYDNIESHQYEPDESEVWKIHQFQRHFEDKYRKNYLTFAKMSDIYRWILTLVIGIACGTIATFISYFTNRITLFKLNIFSSLIEKELNNSIPFGTSFLFLFWSNIILVVIAWCTVFIEPLAAGSGIPEIKCFLNGINIPRIVRLKTLLCKGIGIIFSCGSGLPLGKEGPMVHIGSILAAGLSQGKNLIFGFDTSFSVYQDFRNDKEKRDFVACGAAAGVAAAFASPIGGVLFSLEEGSSFWSTKLTWRCFFCAMATLFTIYTINTASSFFASSGNQAMFSFGKFYSLLGERSNYSVWELLMFMLMGAAGGIIGALFNYINSAVFKKRIKHVRKRPHMELLEAALITAVFTICSFCLPYMWNKCTPLPIVNTPNEQEKDLASHLVSLYCAPSHYNEVASLYLVDSDIAIKQLFHFRELGDANDKTFSSPALLLFFLPYIATACLTCGLAIPAGMFVPSLLSGAAFGRLIGHCLHNLDNTRGTFADAGTYALMGSAAITCGITRMTISLTVMILEGTGDMQYVLPLMLTVMTAKLVGDVFMDGLYDIHIHTRHLHYLTEDENISHVDDLHDLTVKEVMSSQVVVCEERMLVGDVYRLLDRTAHQCYPVVNDAVNNRNLCGTITRKVLCALLKHRAFSSKDSPGVGRSGAGLISWETLECVYPRYTTFDELTVSESDFELIMDLRPYLDIAPYTMNENATVQRTYRMFRTLGLRHLCVVDKFNVVKGIITRANLTDHHVASSRNSGAFDVSAKLLYFRNNLFLKYGARLDNNGNPGSGTGATLRRISFESIDYEKTDITSQLHGRMNGERRRSIV